MIPAPTTPVATTLARVIPLSGLLLALLAGCGSTEWQKAGADDAALTKDLSACNAEAQSQISRMYGPVSPLQTQDPRFGPDFTRLSPADRRLQEQQVAERCMRDRGYALVPARKG